MSKRARRILITLVVLLVATGILLAVFTSNPRRPAAPVAVPQQPATVQNLQANQEDDSTESATATSSPADAPASAASASTDRPDQPQNNASETVPPAVLTGLRAVATWGTASPDAPLRALGSLDPRTGAKMQVEFSLKGARISRVAFAHIWETAAAKRKAERYVASLQPGDFIDTAQFDDAQRYVLTNIATAHSIIVNNQAINLGDQSAWAQTNTGQFESQIVDADDRPLLHLTRTFTLGADYDITLRQLVRNVSGQELSVQWVQFGPVELAKGDGYIDRRRFDLGYIPDAARRPDVVLSGDFHFERGELLKRHKRAAEATTEAERIEHLTLWPPPPGSTGAAYELSWFGSMNRYFSVAIHPTAEHVSRGINSLKDQVGDLRVDVASPNTDNPIIFTWVRSPVFSLAAQAERSIDLGLYVGPLDRGVLAQPAYTSIAMGEMILYSMGGCCTFLSFQWLARLLLSFLALLHDYLVFDWAIAIMLLVGVVRTLLHPLTKKSQINMQRFGKVMSAMKPEVDKLQKKYSNDPKRLQMEQMKLMREHGVNPFQMLGCLPMFLQMPIWIALWAMLYLAFEIRHQEAFYGFFQMFGGWQFLGDLSSPDHFWMLPGGGFTIPFINVKIDALNLLPLLLGVVFFIQQKYMSPPPTPNMTPEQKQQQKIMKVMMVVMFPLFLYKAPSGLTLYIFTSTFIGIIESKYIRAHIDQMDFGKPGGGSGAATPRNEPPKKPKDRLGRLWAEKLEAARAKRQQEQAKSFKRRK